MGLPLALKRTARFYAPPLRRWLARSVTPASFWLIGLCTGLLIADVNVDRVMAVMLAGLAVLWPLRHWAGDAYGPEKTR
jgi:hypothetical protein